MNHQIVKGVEADVLILDQINQHSNGIIDSIAVYDNSTAISAWLESIRGVEEVINIPYFQVDNEVAKELLGLRLDDISHNDINCIVNLLGRSFEDGVVQRFENFLLIAAAIGSAFRMHGLNCGDDFRTLEGAINYFQSKRRQMVALLYLMSHECSGSVPVAPMDAMNIFLPIIEHSCVGLTSLYRNLVLHKIYDDYELSVGPYGFSGNHWFDTLDGAFLEPDRVSITEVSQNQIDMAVLGSALKLDSSRVFSFPELCNDLLAMEAAYAEFKLGETEFGYMARFIVNCSQYAHDEYYVEIDKASFKELARLCNLSYFAQQSLVYGGVSYEEAINSFAPFIYNGRNYITTVTLLSRFAYSFKTACLNKIKRFQIRSGYIFEDKVKNALEDQGFFITDIKRIKRKEFDVVATKGGVIYNVQCKNNLVELKDIEQNPKLFARYNKKIERYYEKALVKEEGRECLLKERFKIEIVRHVVLSKFPVATKNPRILSFRDIGQFSRWFEF